MTDKLCTRGTCLGVFENSDMKSLLLKCFYRRFVELCRTPPVVVPGIIENLLISDGEVERLGDVASSRLFMIAEL